MDSFVVAYKHWLEARQQASKQELTAHQRVALANLDNIKKRTWNGLSEERRREIVGQLVAEGVLPAETTKVMDIFDARVVQI